MSKWNVFGKAIFAWLFAVYTAAVPLLSGDHHIDSGEWVVLALAIGNGILVFLVPVSPALASAKSWINAVLAALAVLQTVIGGGVDMSELALVIGAFLAVVGVAVAPAYSEGNGTRVPTGSDTPIPA